MRWSVHLASPALAVGEPCGAVCPSAERVALGPDAQGRRAEVSIQARDGLLHVTADARWEGTTEWRPDHEEWENRAFLAAMLNPGHDHATRWLYAVDLSAETALDVVADMLVDRFPDWQDALCAAAMWVHHPLVTRHSSTWSRVSNRATVDSVPRLAGCFCGDTTRLTAALAERIGRRTGVALTAYSMGLRGHLATLVASPIGRVVLDRMLGLWFHTLDNARLATLEEMRARREIAERVWYAPRAHGHEFFYGVDNQLIRPWQVGSLRWPEAQG